MVERSETFKVNEMKAPVQREASLGIIKRYLDIRGSSTVMTVKLKGCAECEIDCRFLGARIGN